KGLTDALQAGDINRIPAAHALVLHKLDAFQTMVQKAQGDAADIRQNVSWQTELFATPKATSWDCAAKVREQSRRFIRQYVTPAGGMNQYSPLLQGQVACFRETAQTLGNEDLKQLVKVIEQRLGDPVTLQKAHRDYLLKLQTLVR